ncbi:MAG: 30S ribosomal protein S4 [Planctomycetota bacterium]|nr:30S ribosomal protein S4 [Planctomycetota bacterium]
MGRYTGPKVKKSKRVRAPIAETTKHMKADLDRGPGQHGMSRRRKTTLFGERLREKQKLCFFYHVSDKQFRRLMAEAARSPTNTADKLNELLERRLDNVVRRAGFCRTIWQARQVVVHGHIRVNGKKVDRPSYQVRAGDEISVREKSKKSLTAMAESVDAGNIIPQWLTADPEKLTCKVERVPQQDEIFRPFDTNMLHVVEFIR